MNIIRLKLEIERKDCSFQEISRLFSSDQKTTRVTFWGSRIIEMRGEKGSLSLNAIARRVVEAIIYQNHNRIFSGKEYSFASSVLSEIENCYQLTDQMKIRSGIITRILCSVQDFFSSRVRRDVGILSNTSFSLGDDLLSLLGRK